MRAQPDLLTALACLLRDGALRDEFARNSAGVAARLDIQPQDRASFLSLAPDDLEFQARVLLRKRFQAARAIIPRTCAALGENLWPRFAEYARTCWPADVRDDAFQFIKSIRAANPSLVNLREFYKLDFALNPRRLAVHLLREEHALQILLLRRGRFREWLLTAWQPAPCVPAKTFAASKGPPNLPAL